MVRSEMHPYHLNTKSTTVTPGQIVQHRAIQNLSWSMTHPYRMLSCCSSAKSVSHCSTTRCIFDQKKKAYGQQLIQHLLQCRPNAMQQHLKQHEAITTLLVSDTPHRGNVCPARPAHAQRTIFVLSILSLAPGSSSPWEVHQVDRTRPQTFPARHLA